MTALAPVSMRLVRRIADIVAADASGGMTRQELAAKLHVQPHDPGFEKALAIAAHQHRVVFCYGFVCAPGTQATTVPDTGGAA